MAIASGSSFWYGQCVCWSTLDRKAVCVGCVYWSTLTHMHSAISQVFMLAANLQNYHAYYHSQLQEIKVVLVMITRPKYSRLSC